MFFFIKIIKRQNNSGVGVQILFQVTQHIRDIQLMKSFISFFNCGQYVKPSSKDECYFQCTKFSDNFEILVPFLKNILLEV